MSKPFTGCHNQHMINHEYFGEMRNEFMPNAPAKRTILGSDGEGQAKREACSKKNVSFHNNDKGNPIYWDTCAYAALSQNEGNEETDSSLSDDPNH